MGEEIVQRLRNMKNKNVIKESLEQDKIESKLHEKEEEENEEGVEVPSSEETSDPPAPKEDKSPDEEYIDPEGDTEEENSEDPEGEPSEFSNPLDNPYAVKYTIGDEVLISYSNGTKSKLKGEVEGYDKEGFYRILWSNGFTTNGITDSALSDVINHRSDESKCVCGSMKFVNEGKKLVCDKCGRVLREASKSTEAYVVRYDYDGDELSDYQSHVVAVASSEEEAIRKAKNYKPEGRRFVVERTYASVSEYKRKYPNSNFQILEFSDPLTLADKSRPKGKRMIRSEAHPISTAHPSTSVGEAIKRALKGDKVINEEQDDDNSDGDGDENLAFKRLDSLKGEFWTREDEIVQDIEELGFTVDEHNTEYFLVSTEYEEEYYQLYIPITGTSRTMILDLEKARIVY